MRLPPVGVSGPSHDLFRRLICPLPISGSPHTHASRIRNPTAGREAEEEGCIGNTTDARAVQPYPRAPEAPNRRAPTTARPRQTASRGAGTLREKPMTRCTEGTGAGRATIRSLLLVTTIPLAFSACDTGEKARADAPVAETVMPFAAGQNGPPEGESQPAADSTA